MFEVWNPPPGDLSHRKPKIEIDIVENEKTSRASAERPTEVSALESPIEKNEKRPIMLFMSDPNADADDGSKKSENSENEFEQDEKKPSPIKEAMKVEMEAPKYSNGIKVRVLDQTRGTSNVFYC